MCWQKHCAAGERRAAVQIDDVFGSNRREGAGKGSHTLGKVTRMARTMQGQVGEPTDELIGERARPRLAGSGASDSGLRREISVTSRLVKEGRSTMDHRELLGLLAERGSAHPRSAGGGIKRHASGRLNGGKT